MLLPSKKDEQCLTAEELRQYEDSARTAWKLLGKAEEEAIGLDEFASALEQIGSVIFDSRSAELFSVCAQNGVLMDMTEFEFALQVNDAVQEDNRPSLQEAFNTFDLDNYGRLTLSQYLQVCYTLLGHKQDQARLTKYFFTATSRNKSGRLSYNHFVRVWCSKLSDPLRELEERGLAQSSKGSWQALCRPLLKRNARRRLYQEILLADDKHLARFADARQKVRS
mmetsp:Transcript_22442/g.66542  ORF Transcript_22442/g.66542 Transcript_22442/m.66542 type:complete len:224 (-) Transcript_22442:107-778(-)